MGEPAVAEPIRVFVGLESAGSERERLALAMEELERTGAFDRGLLMVISPTGHGIRQLRRRRGRRVHDPRQHGLGDDAVLAASVAALARPRRRGPRAVPHADRRDPQPPRDRPADKRPRIVLFGESLGAWTSQDAFEHRGTQGLIDAGRRSGAVDRHPVHEQVEATGPEERPARRRPLADRAVQRLRPARGAGPGGAGEAPLRDDHPRRRRRGALRAGPAGAGARMARAARRRARPPSRRASSGAARSRSSRPSST